MKWSNRVQIVTGQTCIHISLHLLLVVCLIAGWKYQALTEVSLMLLAMYTTVFIMMMFAQRIPRLRRLGDFLEEATTTYYFGAAMLVLFLISRIFHSPLLLGLLGLVMLVGPAVVSLLAKEPSVRRVDKRRS